MNCVTGSAESSSICAHRIPTELLHIIPTMIHSFPSLTPPLLTTDSYSYRRRADRRYVFKHRLIYPSALNKVNECRSGITLQTYGLYDYWGVNGNLLARPALCR